MVWHYSWRTLQVLIAIISTFPKGCFQNGDSLSLSSIYFQIPKITTNLQINLHISKIITTFAHFLVQYLSGCAGVLACLIANRKFVNRKSKNNYGKFTKNS